MIIGDKIDLPSYQVERLGDGGLEIISRSPYLALLLHIPKT